jgi:hypothetical protein
VAAVGLEHEQAHGGLARAIRRPSHVQHVRQPLDLDGGIHGQVRPRAARQVGVERDVHRHGAVLRSGIHARDVALHDAVACVHFGQQAECQVARLGFGHAHHRLQALFTGDSRQLLARVHPLPGLEREGLEHALLPGAHGHRGDTLLLEARDRAQALDFGLPQHELRPERLGEQRQALLLALVPLTRLVEVVASAIDVHGRREPLGGQPLGHLERALGLVGGAARLGERGQRGEPLPLQ